MKKVCVCGAEYVSIPKNPTEWNLGEHGVFWLWQCRCRSHLLYPANEATAKKRGLPLLPTDEQFAEAMEGVSDRIKAKKENDIIEADHWAWWENNRLDDDY